MTEPEPPAQPQPEIFEVVINHEDQYAIWPANKDVPPKWRTVGVRGSKDECLAYIRRVWTDMRPASVKRRDRPPSQ